MGILKGVWVLGGDLGFGGFLVASLDSGLLFDATLSIELVNSARVCNSLLEVSILKSEYLSRKTSKCEWVFKI